MCTLLVAVGLWPNHPLVVAANRDERLDRKAAPPQPGCSGDYRTFAPVDLEAGGTWWGLNEMGLLAAITNRFVPGPRPGEVATGRRSRGLLVQDVLSQASAAQAMDSIRSHPGDLHNPFHLVMADAHEAWLCWSDGYQITIQRLARGWHILTERSLGAAPSGREESLRPLLESLTTAPEPPLAELETELRRHAEFGFDGTCVHVAENNYGTRSSLLLRYDGDQPGRMLYADGAPCQAGFTDLSLEMAQALRSGDHSVAK